MALGCWAPSLSMSSQVDEVDSFDAEAVAPTGTDDPYCQAVDACLDECGGPKPGDTVAGILVDTTP